jgi:hypothetical protein
LKTKNNCCAKFYKISIHLRFYFYSDVYFIWSLFIFNYHNKYEHQSWITFINIVTTDVMVWYQDWDVVVVQSVMALNCSQFTTDFDLFIIIIIINTDSVQSLVIILIDLKITSRDKHAIETEWKQAFFYNFVQPEQGFN